MRLPSDLDLRRLPAGDLVLHLQLLARRHRTALTELGDVDPATATRTAKARHTRHRRALGRIARAADRLGVTVTTQEHVVNDNPNTTHVSADRVESVRSAARAFEHAAGRLQTAQGLSGTETGRAMLVAAVAVLGRALPAEDVVRQLGTMAADVATVNGIDLDGPEPPAATH